MKKFTSLLYIIILISPEMNAQNDVISTFLIKWENSKNYLLEIVEAMPEDNFNFKPTERQMTFQKQLLHIRANMVWLSEKYFMDGGLRKSPNIDPKTKKEIIKVLGLSFDNVSDIIKTVTLDDLQTEVDFFSGPKSKLQILNLLQDHVTHHRGQLIVYLNLNEINPPKYRGW